MTSAVSAVVSAIVASACCIGPLVLAALGIGGAGSLLKFEPYRPYFIVLTAALLGLGFYLTYRAPRPPADKTDCSCESPKRTLPKVMLWLATVVAIIALAFPYIAARIFG
ncbi:MAG: mercury transporter MerT [Planctomycetes bacterium]|nr:mercuric transporter MerT family protein [Nannocystis sp.]MBA3547005.1 mercury transporter MerT [Nannocystis sp.]MBA3845022.1 mercury transporter MerT [Planctomycetota bacterium]